MYKYAFVHHTHDTYTPMYISVYVESYVLYIYIYIMYKYAFVNHTHGTYTSLYIAVYTQIIYIFLINKYIT